MIGYLVFNNCKVTQSPIILVVYNAIIDSINAVTMQFQFTAGYRLAGLLIDMHPETDK